MTIKLKQIDLAGASTTSAVTDGLLLTGTEAAELIAGVDGTNHAQFIATDTAGHVLVADGGGSLTVDGTVAVSGTVPVSDGGGSLTVDGSVSVSNFPATQPVSAASLPLPTGAATEATLATRLTEATFTTRTPTVGQKASAASSPVVLASDQSAVPVSAASLPLPTGASTEATLATRLADSTFTGRINTLGQKTSTASTPVVLASDQSAVPVSAASLPLPSGAATETTLGTRLAETTFTTRVPTVGQKTAAGSSPVVLASDQGVLSVSDGGGSLTVDGSVSVSNFPATQPISAASLPLPTGAATETTLGTRLAESTFTTRINTLGQKASAASTPVVLASDQTAIPITDNSGSLTVDGTVTANIGTTAGLALDVTLTGGTLKAIARGGAKGSTVAADVTTTAEGTDHQAVDVQVYHGGTAINPTAIRALTSSDVVTTAQGTAAALSGYWPMRVTDGTNTMPTADTVGRSSFHRVTDGTNTATVKAASTAAAAADAALVVAISPNSTVAVTDNSGSLTVDSAQLPAALVGARLDVNTGAWLGSTAPTVGSKTSANSVPVVIASDQAAIPITDNSGSITVDGTVAVSNSFALDATLTGGTQRTKLTDGTTNAAVKAASTAAVAADPALVVAISPNNTIPISAAALPLPTGASTETTLGTRLADSTFTGRINTQGQKTSAASTPVVLASDQSAVTVSGTVTANVGTTAGLALDATLTGGTVKTITRGGAKGSTAAADVTSTASGSNHQTLDVAIYDALGNQVTSFGGGTQYLDGFGRGTATGTLMMVDDGTNIQSASGDTSGRLNTLSRVTDGTNTAAVKAASTSPVLADPALVVTISPNTNNVILPVSDYPNQTAALTIVAASTSSVTLLVNGHPSRKGVTIVNDSTSALYVKFGTAASNTSYTVLMAANAYYEVPFNYSGIISGVWTTATGNARITNIVP